MIVRNIKKRVLNLAKKIPKGKVTSYKEIAIVLRVHPRLVARALALNPHPVKIPCHRVVYASGEIAGYKLGIKRKIQILKKEGVKIKKGKISEEYFYYFK